MTGLDALKEICHGKQTGDPETTIAPLKGIVQKYIENPLLVGPQRLKFDIRCYMLIARNHPTTLAFYHPGYCRLALKSYDISSVSSLLDPSVHLTNASVQKKDPIYEANKELQVRHYCSNYIACLIMSLSALLRSSPFCLWRAPSRRAATQRVLITCATSWTTKSNCAWWTS